jgi:hypothetical protein
MSETSLKEQFRQQYNKSLEEFGEVKKMVVAVKLPTGATELIINTENIQSKYEYYCTAYDMDMKLNNNKEIQIVGCLFV